MMNLCKIRVAHHPAFDTTVVRQMLLIVKSRAEKGCPIPVHSSKCLILQVPLVEEVQLSELLAKYPPALHVSHLNRRASTVMMKTGNRTHCGEANLLVQNNEASKGN